MAKVIRFPTEPRRKNRYKLYKTVTGRLPCGELNYSNVLNQLPLDADGNPLSVAPPITEESIDAFFSRLWDETMVTNAYIPKSKDIKEAESRIRREEHRRRFRWKKFFNEETKKLRESRKRGSHLTSRNDEEDTPRNPEES